MSQHDLNNFQTGNQAEKPLCFIDLFCGCGGFTLGMERSGFQCLAAVDFNLQAVETLKTNLPHIPHVLHRDLTSFAPEKLAWMIGREHVDVIIGGPPTVKMPCVLT